MLDEAHRPAALYLQGKTGDAAKPDAVRRVLFQNLLRGVVQPVTTVNNDLLHTIR